MSVGTKASLGLRSSHYSPRLPSLYPKQGADSDTAIHLAALYGHIECVRLLLDNGARADVADADGALPLHDAAGVLVAD